MTTDMIYQFNRKNKNNTKAILMGSDEMNSNESLLLDKYRLLLKKAVSKTVKNAHIYDVDDIVQEACTRVLKAIRNKNPVKNMESYVYRIGVTTAIDALRKIKSRKESTMEDVCSTIRHQIDYCSPPSPDDEYQAEQMIVRIKAVLNQLAENRKATVLLHIQGYSIEKIAEKLQWSEAKVRNLIYRGMSELRSKLNFKE